MSAKEWQSPGGLRLIWNLGNEKTAFLTNLHYTGSDGFVTLFCIGNCEYLFFKKVPLSLFHDNLFCLYGVSPGMHVSLEIEGKSDGEIWWEYEQLNRRSFAGIEGLFDDDPPELDPRIDPDALRPRPQNLMRKRRDYLAIEVEIKAVCFGEVKLPEGMFKLERLHFDRYWSRDVLVTLRMGSRELVRVPTSRFVRDGVGVAIRWTAGLGDKREMILVNLGPHDMTVRGCIDYTHLVEDR